MRKCLFVVVVYWVALCCSLATSANAAGAWGQIETDLSRDEAWTQIVQGSSFQLGERHKIEEIAGQVLWERGYGTYPNLDGSTVAVPMALEFARQHLGLSDWMRRGLYSFLPPTALMKT